MLGAADLVYFTVATNKKEGSNTNLSFEEGWPVLQKDAINKLIHLLEEKGHQHTNFFTSQEYMRLYTIVYDMCRYDFRGPEAEKLYEHYQKTFEDYASSKVLPHLRGKKDEILLKELIEQWNRHKIMTRWLSRFFHYLNRYYIPVLKLPTLQQTSHLVFYNLVYGEMNDQIRDALISTINLERDGKQIDRILVKNVVDIYVEMAEDSTKYYEQDFENALLLETATFYSHKASTWITTYSYDMYMLKVEECLKQEKIRVDAYLRYRSKEKLLEGGITKLKNILEGNSETQFYSEEYMILYETIYRMCKQEPPHDYSQRLYDKYRETFEEYVTSTVLPCLRGKRDEFMLRELVKRWSNHKIMVRWLSRFFHYLDRYFIVRRSLPALNEVGLICFRDLVYQEVKTKVRDAVISLIDQEREGQQIDRALLKNVTDIFVEIGMGKMDYYENDFEAAMVNDTAAYYSRKASSWILQDPQTDYMMELVN